MIILGIDPGTARMGYSIMEANSNSKYKLIHYDCMQTHQDYEMQYRLRFLYKELREITKKFSPDVMVLERIFFNVNAKTAIHVGQARGVALLAAAETKMKVFEYTALEAKKVVTGFGRADKKQMQAAVRDYLKLDDIIKSDDANDAVAMALCFINKDYINAA